MKKCTLALLLLVATAAVAQTKARFTAKPVWAEEFNYKGIPDTSHWSYDTGGHGWGNNELQYYRDSGNAWVNGSELVITAQPDRSEERRVGKECRSRWSPY